jgi:hypothetical protein
MCSKKPSGHDSKQLPSYNTFETSWHAVQNNGDIVYKLRKKLPLKKLQQKVIWLLPKKLQQKWKEVMK